MGSGVGSASRAGIGVGEVAAVAVLCAAAADSVGAGRASREQAQAASDTTATTRAKEPLMRRSIATYRAARIDGSSRRSARATRHVFVDAQGVVVKAIRDGLRHCVAAHLASSGKRRSKRLMRRV